MPPEPALALVENDPFAEELMALLAHATGNARLSAANSPVLDRVRSRLVETGVSSLAAYLALLRDGEKGRRELEAVIARLTVGETFFFRQPEHFAVLRDVVLPACLSRNAATRQLRIWSAGCANGAEPYSIAIQLYSLLGHDLAGWTVTIVGSDINSAFLGEASAATYSAWTMRGLTKSQIQEFFLKTDAGWELCDRYRAHVRFVQHNLIHDDVPSFAHHIHAFDVVFCRNVMLYFDDASNALAVRSLASALIDGGFLFVAPTDVNPHLAAMFTQEGALGAGLYRKRARRPVAGPVSTPARAAAATTPAFVRAHDSQGRIASAGRPTVGAHRRPRSSHRPGRMSRGAAKGLPAEVGTSDLAAIMALANRGDLAKAGRMTAQMLAADPLNAAAHYCDALIFLGCNHPDDAEAALKRALYLDRGFSLAHYQLALLRAADGDAAGARKGLATVIDLLLHASDGEPVGPGDDIDAGTLRALALHQIEHLGG